LLVVAIVVLVRSFTGGGQRLPFRGSTTAAAPYGQPGPAAATPEQVLAVRFARGEIDEDEFHQRMAALRAEAPHPGSAGTPSWGGQAKTRGLGGRRGPKTPRWGGAPPRASLTGARARAAASAACWSAVAGTVTLPRSLPLTCTGSSISSSTSAAGS